VNVLGHEDTGPQVEAMLGLAERYRLSKPAAGSLRREKRLATQAGKGQGMSMSGVVIPPASFSVRPVAGIPCGHVHILKDGGQIRNER
jgi:hypothetical protein